MTELSKLDNFKHYTDVGESIESITDRLAEYGEMIFVGLGEAEDSKLREFSEICEWAFKQYVGVSDD